MNSSTKTFLLAVAAGLSTILTAFVVWINSFDPPAPPPAPEPPPVVVVPPVEPPNPAAFAITTTGASRAFAGHNLYFAIEGKREPGNKENTYISVKAPTGIAATLPDIARSCCADAGGYFMWEPDASFLTSGCLSLPKSIAPGDYSATVEIKNSRTQQTVKLAFTVLAVPTPATPKFSPLPALPSVAKYDEQMVTKGRAQLSKRGYDTWEGNAWYYDGTRVAYQIADYTGDKTFADYAKNPLDVYRPYVLQNNGWVGGWRSFAQGLRMHFERTGDEASKDAAIRLLNNAYGPNHNITVDLIPEAMSREVAYAIETMLEAEKLGKARNPRLSEYVDIALGHIDQWFVQEKFQVMAPFMFGLIAEALIKWHEVTGDPRILPALKMGADWIWAKAWQADKQAFVYEINGDATAAPDLNLLIAPVYGWLYAQTGDKSYIDKGDQIFSGGVEGAWLDQGKQFNQNYRWSMDYLKWRGTK